MNFPNKFRSAINTRYTEALFLERARSLDTVLYTLKGVDTTDYPSLYRLYMTLEDTTEWEFGRTFFEDYEHWTILCETEWFKPYIQRWRRELELKLKARALRSIKEMAKDGVKSFEANKYLLDKAYVEVDKTSRASHNRGRPTKDEVRKAAEDQALDIKQTNDDMKRLGLN